MLYTCDFPDCVRHGEILRSNLAAIGIDLTVHQFTLEEMFKRLETPGEPFDLAYSNWFADYVDPLNFLQLWDVDGRMGTCSKTPASTEPSRGLRR